MRRTFTAFPLFLLFVLFVSLSHAQPIYNPGTNHWYELNQSLLSFDDAQAYAVSKGGYLACITSAAENLWISNNFTPDDLEYAMIGGNDILKEGTWKWIDGEPWSFENWIGIEPNNGHGNEDWAAFKAYKSTDTFWWVDNVGYGWMDLGNEQEWKSLIEYDSQPGGAPVQDLDGIWKPSDQSMSFYVQTYDTGSAVVIATADLSRLFVFLDSDVSNGINVSDLAGNGDHIVMNFTDSQTATATLTTGGSTKNYTLSKLFGMASDPSNQGIWKTPSCTGGGDELLFAELCCGFGYCNRDSGLREILCVSGFRFQ